MVSIGYSMFCVGYRIYTKSGAPEYILHNQHKYCITYLDPAVSFVAAKWVPHHKIYTVCGTVLHFIKESVIFSYGCAHCVAFY